MDIGQSVSMAAVFHTGGAAAGLLTSTHHVSDEDLWQEQCYANFLSACLQCEQRLTGAACVKCLRLPFIFCSSSSSSIGSVTFSGNEILFFLHAGFISLFLVAPM